VLAFSDLQADITTELVKRGYSVFTFNQRSVAEILQMIRMLGGIVGVPEKAADLVASLERGLEEIRASATQLPRRPRVYFEEWDDPLIGGIRWTEELIEIAGGEPVFPEHRDASLAKDRIVTSDQVIARAPDIIIGSWCGKPVRVEKIKARPGWDQIPAVRDGHIYEVKSTYILQPGPAALTEGVAQIAAILQRWAVSSAR
ncbi:MAG: ABC transporter substrate-binding protein, partial [Vicinamibacterales bacterium]